MGKSTVTSILIIASFIEGGVLMAFEVLSAKIYTPFLGASIYVWTSILTVTLIGLAVGYWWGGKLSLKNSKKLLIRSFLIAGILILGSTFIADIILPGLLNMSIKGASIVAGFMVLFVPVLFLGTVSPLIIGLLHNMGRKLSTTTGLIFGIGTVGGIVLLLTTVFVFIPTIGVRNSSYVLGLLLLLMATALYFTIIQSDEQK